MKGDISPLITAVVLLSILLVSIDCNCETPNNQTAEWIIEKCLTSKEDKESSVVCYTPTASLISCEGIRNADNCSKAIAKYAVSPSAALSRLTKDSFVFDVQNHRLCFKPQIEPLGSVHTFFGYDLWVEFFDSANPDAKHLVRLGAIFRSGVPNRTTLQSTFGCVKTPAHIPYRNTSFFISTGNTLPIQAYSPRTKQEKGYSLGSLRKVSFTDGAYLKDYVNSSTPLFQFKCSPNYPPPPKHGKRNEWVWILLVIGAIVLIAGIGLIGFLVYKFWWLKRNTIPTGSSVDDGSVNNDSDPDPDLDPDNGQNPNAVFPTGDGQSTRPINPPDNSFELNTVIGNIEPHNGQNTIAAGSSAC